jgi:hypothetical protein
MAIAWALEITPINLATKEASIHAVRTDDTDGSTLSFDVAKAKIDTVTMTNNLWILDEIWNKYQAHLALTAAVSDFVSALESAGKTDLEARE